MKREKASEAPKSPADELKPEYRFDYRKARPNRFAGKFGPESMVVTVTLDPDVADVFQTSQAVNSALRTLIATITTKRHC